MYDRNAPAKLFRWPSEDEGETVFPTLDEALLAAEQSPSNSWIITQAGDILNPRKIAELRLEAPDPRRRRGPLHIFGLYP